MCEYTDPGYPKGLCKARGSFWVRSPKGNLIVCGKHLSLSVKKLATGDSKNPTTVKMRLGNSNRWA